ncbi:hypothetical protein [Microbacterium xylanilyticum]
MLAFLGALIPVLASLYVGIGTLVDLSAAAHKARVVKRVWARFKEERAQIDDKDPELGAKVKRLTDQRMRLLEANGLDPMIGTIRAFSESVLPAAPLLKEFRRQWVLIFGAVVGVVLVGIQVGIDSLAS